MDRILVFEGRKMRETEFRRCEVSLGNDCRVLEREVFDGFEEIRSLSIPEGIEALAVQSLPRQLTFTCDVILPDSIRKISAGFFSNIVIEGNLCLPDRLERICVWALDDCQCAKGINIPSGLKYLGSFPNDGILKGEEVILPEGLLEVRDVRIITGHLHIPSTLRCFNVFRSDIGRISIAEGNKNLAVSGGRIINLREEKNNKLRQLYQKQMELTLEQILTEAGFEYSLKYNNALRFPLTKSQEIGFSVNPKNFVSIGPRLQKRMNQMMDIVRRFHALMADFPSLRDSDRLTLGSNLNRFTTDTCVYFKCKYGCFGMKMDKENSDLDEFNRFCSKFISTSSGIESDYGVKHVEYSFC